MINKKLCIVKSSGVLPLPGNIDGPILNPCELPIQNIITMINLGMKVYEINPKDRNQSILLTRDNVNKNNFIDIQENKNDNKKIIKEKQINKRSKSSRKKKLEKLKENVTNNKTDNNNTNTDFDINTPDIY